MSCRFPRRAPFSSPQYSTRQQEYTNRYNFNGVYTPQLVVDGRYGLIGSDGKEASAAIQRAIRERKVPMATRVLRGMEIMSLRGSNCLLVRTLKAQRGFCTWR